MIDIKDIDGNIRFSTPVNRGSKRKFTLMKEDYITLKFSLDIPLNFKLGDSVDDTFGLFELMELYKPAYNKETGGYDYELRLDAYYWKWKNKIFKFTPEKGGQEAAWNLTAPLDTQMDVFLRNLHALGYTYKGKVFEYTIDNTVNNSAKLMSYDSTNMIDALSKMAEAWECEWWVTDSIIHFGRCEYGTPVDFRLGENVEEMTRSQSQDNYVTRIYAFGSTKNLPSDYRPVDENVIIKGVVQKRLMLPADTPYIDAYPGMNTEEAIEDIVVFEDVYPHRIGTMSGVTPHEYIEKIEEENKEPVFKKWNVYRFKDTGLNFSKDYILPGQELKIIFQSGELNGMEFSVIFNPCDEEGGETPVSEKLPDGSFNPLAQVWEICRNEDYGRPLPDNMLVPKDGDTYILTGFNTKFVADSMIPDAEKELKEKAEKYIEKIKVDPSTYTVKMISEQMINEDGIPELLEVGDKVNLFNSAYFETGCRSSRIIGFEYNLDIPSDSPVYIVGETASYSRIGDLENKIESLIVKQTASRGSGSGLYVIGTNDSVPPTNKNVFSALRSFAEFVSKKRDDIVRGVITFTKKIKSLSGIEFGSFVADSTGGAVYKDEQGNWHFEGDFFHVRKKLMAEEVEIQHTTHIGGKLINTAASMICSKVEEYDTSFRCYFNREDADGRRVYNQFKVGDQGFVETFNLQSQSDGKLGNHYLWRLVTVVGDNFIDLSKTDCEKSSDIPEAGDIIIQLGNRTNVSRQGAIIDASAGGGAPYIRIYKGINSYTLPKPVIDLNPEQSEICAKFVSVATGKSFDEMLSDIQINLDTIKQQTDKEYILWFFEYDPTLDNLPASDWNTDELKAMHEEDMFYNRITGYAYRFEKSNDVWVWNNITDQQTIKALEKAAKAQDTADGKRQVFVEQPAAEDAYDVGDIWVNATYSGEGVTYKNDSLVCKTAKTAGAAFSIAHWQPTSAVTTGYIENQGERITALVNKISFDSSGNVMNINTSGLVTENNFASLFSEQVTADGLVKSADISTFITADEAGELISKAEISADQIDFLGKTVINGKFIVDKNGNVTMTDFTANNGIFNGTVNADNGRIGGFKISGNSLTNEGFDNDATIIFRHDRYGIFSAIGCNTLPASTGLRAVARFENNNAEGGALWGSSNYALILSAANAAENYALLMQSGYVAGFRLKPLVLHSNATFDKISNVVLLAGTGTVVLTLPIMTANDNGQFLMIKNVDGGTKRIKVASTQPIMYNQGDWVAYSNAGYLTLSANGDAMTLIFCWGLGRKGFSDTGAWIQFKNPRDW